MSAHRHRNGGARISTTPWGAVDNRATPTRNFRPSLSAALVTGFVAAMFGAALFAAGPAAAADDPTRPDASVTHGPSCRPGGLVVEVVAGTNPYTVTLATTRTPSGEDHATLRPGETIVLHSGDVAYGETIDGRLEFAAQDGTGVTYVDELVEYSFTRPSKEDCDAIADPTTESATPSPSDTAGPTASGAAAPSTSAGPATASSTDSRTPAPAGSASTGGATPSLVTAGQSVTLTAAGFQPGELVTIQLNGSDEVLGTATAGPDGSVQADVRIPDGTDAGDTTVHLFGTQSEIVADVDLRVAAAETSLGAAGSTGIVPLVAAALALVAASGGLFSVVGRHRGSRPTVRSA
jgi:hypothetical protein